MIESLFNKTTGDGELSRSEIISLITLDQSSKVSKLYSMADESRVKHCGEEVHLRAVVDISNYCVKHCLYCENREENYSLKRYRLEPDEIIETAKVIAKLGVGTIVLQSGEDVKLDTDIVAYIIYSIKKSTDLAVTLNLGERGLDEYRTWKIAGADRYILKFETSNSKEYSIHTNKKSLSDRVQHLKYLQRLGYQIGSGNIIGLPSQSNEDIADDLLLLKELDVDTAIFDAFIPTPHTPYQNVEKVNVNTVLKTIAVARLLLRNVHITTNLFEFYTELNQKTLECGVNILMVSFTPEPYRSYTNLISSGDFKIDPFENQKRIIQSIEKIGRQLSFSRGDSLKKNSSITL